MRKITNILVMLMLITASAGIAEAKLLAEDSSSITNYLKSLSLISGWSSGAFYLDKTDAQGSLIYAPTQRFIANEPAYTEILADGIPYQSSCGGGSNQATITVGDWGSTTVNLPCNWQSNKIIVPVTPKQAGQTSVVVTMTILGQTESKTYTIGSGAVLSSNTYPTPTTTATGTPTPTVTGTPAPTGKPVLIPPALSRLLATIGAWFKGLFGLSITGGQTVAATVNQPYSTTLSLAFTAPNTNFAGGTYQSKYGEWFIMDSAKNVKLESGWSSELTTSPYTATATFTPTTAGTYFLVGIVLTQNYVYGATGWTMTETIETKEVQQIDAKIPSVTKQSPTTTTTGIIASITAWIKSLFTWLPW